MDWVTCLTIVATAFLTAFGGWIFNLLRTGGKKAIQKQQEEEKKQESMRRGLQALLRSKLYDLYDKCIEQGFTTEREFSNFENMYEQYHNLGKNGVMDRYWEDMQKLPIKK